MSQQAAFDPINENSMSLLEHLQELRSRLIWIVSGLVACTMLSMLFVTPILEFIIEPLTLEGVVPQALGPTDTVGIFFKVSFTMGASLAMPVIVYQLIAFVSPGLYPNERRALLLTLPGVMVLFLLGAAFAFYLLMPAAVNFLQQFLGDVIRQDWTIDRYIGFVTRIVFWMGVAFETPLVVAFLARRCGLWAALARFLAALDCHCRRLGRRHYAHHRPYQYDHRHGAVDCAVSYQCRLGLPALSPARAT